MGSVVQTMGHANPKTTETLTVKERSGIPSSLPMYTHTSHDGATQPEEPGVIPSSLPMKKEQMTERIETGQPRSKSNQGKESLPGRGEEEAAPLRESSTEGKTPPKSEPKTEDDTSPDSAASKLLIFNFGSSDTIELKVHHPISNLNTVFDHAVSQRTREAGRVYFMIMRANDSGTQDLVANAHLVNDYLETHDSLQIYVVGVHRKSLPLSQLPCLKEGSHIEVAKKDVCQLLLNWLGLTGILPPDWNSIVFRILKPSEHSSVYHAEFFSCNPPTESANEAGFHKEVLLNVSGMVMESDQIFSICSYHELNAAQLSQLRLAILNLPKQVIANQLMERFGVQVPLSLKPQVEPTTPGTKIHPELEANARSEDKPHIHPPKKRKFEQQVQPHMYRTVFYILQLLWTQLIEYHRDPQKVEAKTSTRRSYTEFARQYTLKAYKYLEGIHYENSKVTSVTQLATSIKRFLTETRKNHGAKGLFIWTPKLQLVDSELSRVACFTTYLASLNLCKLPHLKDVMEVPPHGVP